MNRYIKAMEIGNAHEKEGITYVSLKELMELHLNYKFDKESEFTFFNWFINNFFYANQVDASNNKSIYDFKRYHREKSIIYQFENHDQKQLILRVERELNERWFLRGEASKQYLDYLELTESREASKKALSKANTSVWIAVGALILSTVFSVLEYSKKPVEYPQPLYNVNINETLDVKVSEPLNVNVLNDNSKAN